VAQTFISTSSRATVRRFTTQGGEDRTVRLRAGEASWSTGPVIHAAEANHAVELIVIELK
jgi:hypothetical protein